MGNSWRVVGRHELRELWGGSKGLLVLLGYAALLSVMAYAAASDADLNLLDARSRSASWCRWRSA